MYVVNGGVKRVLPLAPCYQIELSYYNPKNLQGVGMVQFNLATPTYMQQHKCNILTCITIQINPI